MLAGPGTLAGPVSYRTLAGSVRRGSGRNFAQEAKDGPQPAVLGRDGDVEADDQRLGIGGLEHSAGRHDPWAAA